MFGNLGWMVVWCLVAQLAPELPSDTKDVRIAAAPRAKPRSEAAAPSSIPLSGQVAAPEGGASDAERIARLQRSVDTDESRLRELKRALNDPYSEYARAEKAFKELDAQLELTRHNLQEAQAAGRTNEVATFEQMLTQQTEPWNAAKIAFELALEERRTKQASIATLEAKLQRDREAAEKLLTPEPPPSSTAVPPTPDPTIAPLPSPQSPGRTLTAPGEVPAIPAPLPVPLAPPVEPVVPPNVGSASPLMNALLPSLPDGTSNTGPSTQQPKPNTELIAATAKAEKLVAAADVAEKEALSITERLELLKQDIAQQRTLREVALKKLDAAEEETSRLTKDLEQNPQGGEKWDEIWSQLTQAQQRAAASRVEARTLADRLDELQSELSSLQQDELAQLHEVSKIRSEAQAAQLAVNELSNPFSVRNLTHWLQTKGLIVALAFLTVISVLRMGTYVEPRLTQIFISTSPRGSREERENRATTLVGVLLNVTRTVVVVVGVITILEQFGVPVAPLLGGAAVIGLAVAFGAQSLIKDYFTGFMVLLEQQYMINDVIKIGEIEGQVERITMRMTVLRDLEGRVHFIPHGQISTVTNLTHGWSRALIDVSVSYKSDLDHVIEVLIALGQELRHDPKFGQMILENPEMLGVEALDDSAVIVRMMVKTRPLRQWELKREWLKRVKRRFDELGIDIPYPHQTIYLRTMGEEAIRPLTSLNERVSRAS